ncbi:DMT family transporter [Paenibacillus hamazuiensis]|uniref:DMT family transporter n=1 Tax=Paenibacillus hamazuiensis TaxID=2936508 RepID=UPI0020104704|nr:DMT family transporter [Paenibacillus hamazuiensis]
MWLLYASASAVCFGLRGILYQWTSKKPIDRNMLLLGVYVSGTLVALIANGFIRQPWTTGAWIGILMGLFSFASNASMYKGFAVGKASLVAILTALPPVVVVGIAFLLWGEKLNAWQTFSFAVIVAGILMVRYSNDISLKNLQGAHWGILAMLMFGFTDLASKQSTLLGGQTLPTLTVMYATGSLLFLLSGAAARMRERQRGTRHASDAKARAETAAGREAVASKTAPETLTPVPAPQWPLVRTLLWGMVVGLTNISGMMLVLPAFRLGVTGLVSAVIAANVLLILLYARFVLKEKFSRLEIGGMVLAIAGILILRVTG